MAGHIMNFFNGVHHAKKLITQGRIGKVLCAMPLVQVGKNSNQLYHGRNFVLNLGYCHHIRDGCIQFIMGELLKKRQ